MTGRLVSVLIGVVIGAVMGMAHVEAVESRVPGFVAPQEREDVVIAESVTEGLERPTVPYATYSALAALVMAEAGNQDEYGKRLVVDTVLNRVNDSQFPNTIMEVIRQPYQFSVVWNGEMQKYLDGRKEIPDDIYTLIDQELVDQADYEVVFFQSSGWSPYGQHAYKYGDHYFSRW